MRSLNSPEQSRAEQAVFAAENAAPPPSPPGLWRPSEGTEQSGERILYRFVPLDGAIWNSKDSAKVFVAPLKICCLVVIVLYLC
ncbi:hypothetical protein TYRP_021439 [Tyrophagus putrescentiae]|nr:hypothetical protein TYRP_021439 [Tyrophagus putrescentiae]